MNELNVTSASSALASAPPPAPPPGRGPQEPALPSVLAEDGPVAQPPVEPPGQEQRATGESLALAVEKVNIKLTATSIHFEIDEDTGETQISVVDKETGEVIRRIPPDELVRISSTLSDLRGLLFDSQG